jgi:hypothetical protein
MLLLAPLHVALCPTFGRHTNLSEVASNVFGGGLPISRALGYLDLGVTDIPSLTTHDEESMPAPYRGSCQCGGIEFEINAEPLTIYVCHCNACKKQSGTSFGMAMVVAVEALSVVRGIPKTYKKKAESGRSADCDFCAECGNRLFHRLGEAAPIVLVKMGLIDNAATLSPVAHLWTRHKDDWIALPQDLLVYDQQPTDNFAEAIDFYRRRTDQRKTYGRVSVARE